jgi:hypothetical protein
MLSTSSSAMGGKYCGHLHIRSFRKFLRHVFLPENTTGDSSDGNVSDHEWERRRIVMRFIWLIATFSVRNPDSSQYVAGWWIRPTAAKPAVTRLKKAGLGPVGGPWCGAMLTQSMAVSALPLLMTCWPNSAPFEGEKQCGWKSHQRKCQRRW